MCIRDRSNAASCAGRKSGSLIQLHADSRKRERILAKKKATSSQVAEKAGVSQATVSMILNRRSNVSFSAETVEKVECAARELGYELPHRKNKSNTRKEKLIVVLCPTLTSPYYVLLLQGIESVANEKGYGVFTCNTQSCLLYTSRCV